MEQYIIAYANEIGYFPTRKQAEEIWMHINLFMANVAIEQGKKACNSDENYHKSFQSSIKKVMDTVDNRAVEKVKPG